MEQRSRSEADFAFLERWRCLNAASAVLKKELFSIPIQKSDMFIVTHPKSGTSWISQIVQLIRTRGKLLIEKNFMKEAIPPFSAHGIISGFHPGQIEQRGSPRCFFTHYYVSQLPPGHGKVIYVARRPEDVILSYYKFASDYVGLGADPPSPETFYFDWYKNPGDHRMTVWSHLLDAWEARQKYGNNLLWLHYEDLQKDIITCIKSIARFMEVQLTQRELDLVQQYSSYQYMLEHPDESDGVHELQMEMWKNLGRKDVAEMVIGRVREGKEGRGRFELPEAIREDIRQGWDQQLRPKLHLADYEDLWKQTSILEQY